MSYNVVHNDSYGFVEGVRKDQAKQFIFGTETLTDLNDIQFNGLYWAYDETLNIPYAGGSFLVICTNSGHRQLAISMINRVDSGQKATYSRYYNGVTGWTPWVGF